MQFLDKKLSGEAKADVRKKFEKNMSLNKLADAYHNFKEGDVYRNMSKKEKREMTQASFIEKFKSHINFKHYYKARDWTEGLNYGILLLCFFGLCVFSGISLALIVIVYTNINT